MSEQAVRVTVAAEDVAAIPGSALGIGSMVGIGGTAPDGQTVHFKASGSHVEVAKRAGAPYIVDLEPHEILTPGQE